MKKFDPNVIPVEWTEAVMRGMARRRPVAQGRSAIIEAAQDATTVLGEIWPLVVAEVERAEARGPR